MKRADIKKGVNITEAPTNTEASASIMSLIDRASLQDVNIDTNVTTEPNTFNILCLHTSSANTLSLTNGVSIGDFNVIYVNNTGTSKTWTINGAGFLNTDGTTISNLTISTNGLYQFIWNGTKWVYTALNENDNLAKRDLSNITDTGILAKKDLSNIDINKFNELVSQYKRHIQTSNIKKFGVDDLLKGDPNTGLQPYVIMPHITSIRALRLKQASDNKFYTITTHEMPYDASNKTTIQFNVFIPKTGWTVEMDGDDVKDTKNTSFSNKDIHGFRIKDATNNYWYYRINEDAGGTFDSVTIELHNLDEEYTHNSVVYDKIVIINVKGTVVKNSYDEYELEAELWISNPYNTTKDSLPFMLYAKAGTHNLDLDYLYNNTKQIKLEPAKLPTELFTQTSGKFFVRKADNSLPTGIDSSKVWSLSDQESSKGGTAPSGKNHIELPVGILSFRLAGGGGGGSHWGDNNGSDGGSTTFDSTIATGGRGGVPENNHGSSRDGQAPISVTAANSAMIKYGHGGKGGQGSAESGFNGRSGADGEYGNVVIFKKKIDAGFTGDFVVGDGGDGSKEVGGTKRGIDGEPGFIQVKYQTGTAVTGTVVNNSGSSSSSSDTNKADKDGGNITNPSQWVTKLKTALDSGYQSKGSYLTGIANDYITSIMIKSDAIITSKIKDKNITTAKLADNVLQGYNKTNDIELKNIKDFNGKTLTNDYIVAYDSSIGGFKLIPQPSGSGSSSAPADMMKYDLSNITVAGKATLRRLSPAHPMVKGTDFTITNKDTVFFETISGMAKDITISPPSNPNDKDYFHLIFFHKAGDKKAYLSINGGQVDMDPYLGLRLHYEYDANASLWVQTQLYRVLYTDAAWDAANKDYLKISAANSKFATQIVKEDSEWSTTGGTPIPNNVKAMTKGSLLQWNGNLYSVNKEGTNLVQAPDLQPADYNLLIPNKHASWSSSYTKYAKGELVFHNNTWWRCKSNAINIEPSASNTINWEKYEGVGNHEDWLRWDGGKIRSNSGHEITLNNSGATTLGGLTDVNDASSPSANKSYILKRNSSSKYDVTELNLSDYAKKDATNITVSDYQTKLKIPSDTTTSLNAKFNIPTDGTNVVRVDSSFDLKGIVNSKEETLTGSGTGDIPRTDKHLILKAQRALLTDSSGNNKRFVMQNGNNWVSVRYGPNGVMKENVIGIKDSIVTVDTQTSGAKITDFYVNSTKVELMSKTDITTELNKKATVNSVTTLSNTVANKQDKISSFVQSVSWSSNKVNVVDKSGTTTSFAVTDTNALHKDLSSKNYIAGIARNSYMVNDKVQNFGHGLFENEAGILLKPWGFAPQFLPFRMEMIPANDDKKFDFLNTNEVHADKDDKLTLSFIVFIEKSGWSVTKSGNPATVTDQTKSSYLHGFKITNSGNSKNWYYRVGQKDFGSLQTVNILETNLPREYKHNSTVYDRCVIVNLQCTRNTTNHRINFDFIIEHNDDSNSGSSKESLPIAVISRTGHHDLADTSFLNETKGSTAFIKKFEVQNDTLVVETV